MTLQEQTENAAKTIASIRTNPLFKKGESDILIRKTCAKHGTNEAYIRKVAGWAKKTQ